MGLVIICICFKQGSFLNEYSFLNSLETNIEFLFFLLKIIPIVDI